MGTAGATRSSSRWLFWTTLIAAAVVLGTFSSIFFTILRDAGKQELHPADAIIAFGAAKYDGRPSPVFKARLEHVMQLFRKGLPPVSITPGGASDDPQLSDAL